MNGSLEGSGARELAVRFETAALEGVGIQRKAFKQ